MTPAQRPHLAPTVTRRDMLKTSAGLTGGLIAASRFSDLAAQADDQGATPAPGLAADDIVALARDAMAEMDLRAVILRVVIDGEEIVTEALGESMTGQPATTDMHFRNGAVAISYMSTLLLILVDEGLVSLDDTIDAWLPELPFADQVTLRMLANMTSGYPDYVQNPDFVDHIYEDVFRQYTDQELIDYGLAVPRSFEPGTNWAYSHTDYVILGQALEQITGEPLGTMLQEQVLDPLGLANTASHSTPFIPEPVLHAFSSERRGPLGIDPGTRFYEESTFWNPSWTLPEGAVQTTNISDMTASAIAIGTGTLLSEASHQAQIAPDLLGFGEFLEGCANCAPMTEGYTYGLGVVLRRGWLVQNPLFGGYSGIEAYQPEHRIAVAVATTYGEGSFDEEGNYIYGNASVPIFEAISNYLVPPDGTPEAG
jgi:CubicO group peptidase (beta-lactamase class C family)